MSAPPITSNQLPAVDDGNLGAERQRKTRHQGQSLCKWCRKLDFDSIRRQRHPTAVGNMVRKRSLAAQPNLKSCPLCKLFDKTYDTSSANGETRYILRSFSSSRIRQRGWASVDTIMLSLDQGTRTPFLVPQAKGAPGPVRVLGPRVDVKLLREWMDHCRERHSKVCGILEDPSPLSSTRSFKVIDCETRRVVVWSGQPYATLSYVWGTDSTAPDFAWALPDELPGTIEDAVQLARKLGIGHLWVDRYCINQQDREEVDEQVGKMDLIYQISDVTIIGAAGEGAENRLPGVREDRALKQPHAMVGKYHVVSSMEDPTASVRASKWWTRGWTYQEGLMARRRLIFTEQQVYFECGGMYSCESLNLDLVALHVGSGQRFRSEYRNGINLGLFPARLGHQAWEIIERIGEYSRRTLTNPGDVLKGLGGILRALESSPMQLRHLFGVPIMPRPRRPISLGYDSREDGDAIFESQIWTPTTGFCVGLAWTSEKPLKRRLVVPNQPTWSWTGWTDPVAGDRGGWTGPVKWTFDERRWRAFQGNTDIEVSVKLKDGGTLPWDDFYTQYDILGAQVTETLHLSAWTTPIHVRRSEGRILSVKVEDADGARWRWTGDWPAEMRLVQEGTPLLGIPLGKETGGPFLQTHVLVVTLVMPGIYERVGMGAWSHMNLRQRLTTEKDEDRALMVSGLEPPALSMAWKDFQLR